MKPPCSIWKIWTGKEVEGKNSLGVETLFVRALPQNITPKVLKASHPHIDRVWLCKELQFSAALLREFVTYFGERCIEVVLGDRRPTKESRAIIELHFRVYLKIPVRLKKGDVICVGEAFNDEAFEIGAGARVSPSWYLGDKEVHIETP